MLNVLFLFCFLLPLSTPYYVINVTDMTGPMFDGIGAISGGGGETILLPSYPSQQKNEILDFLFKPKYGASLHMLKVEIGGDALSTDGSEPSHMHTESAPPNFQRGYEWWIMNQAKQRNEEIRLYGLPWEWPQWIGAGTLDPYHNISKPLHYVLEWMRGAESVHNLTLDYIGIWNERQCNPNYVVALRKALNGAGYKHTRIIAPDSAIPEANELLQAMVSNPELADAVHAVGYHYPNSNPNISDDILQELHYKRIWASEDDSSVDPPISAPATPRPRKQFGGGCLVRTINQNYIVGNITSTIVWNLIMARYPQLRWDYTGLMAATDPFNGSYDVLPPVWAAAHTTQFTEPGWRLLPVVAEYEYKHGHGQAAAGGSGWLELGGTYVSYVDGSGELTIVIEKMDATQSTCQRGSRPENQIAITTAENVTFVIAESIAATHLVLWSSHFGLNHNSSGQQQLDSNMFVQKSDVPIVNGTVTIEVIPNHAYTLSTVRTATKGGGRQHISKTIVGVGAAPQTVQDIGSALTRHSSSFPHKYSDHFDNCVMSSIPKYVASMAGAFECVAASSGRTGLSLRQMSPAMSICDRGDVLPYAIIGDGFRTTYNLTIDILLAQGVGAFIGARTKGPVGSGTGMDGIFLGMNSTNWMVTLQIAALYNHGTIQNQNSKVIDSGILPKSTDCTPSSWCTLSLVVSGVAATASIDGVVVVSDLKIPAPYNHYTARVAGDIVDLGKGGYASFGTIGYGPVEFDDLNIQSTFGEMNL